VSTRVKALAGGAGLVMLAMLIMGLLMVQHQLEVNEQEVRNKTTVLLAAVSVPCVSALAANKVEELERIIEEFRLRLPKSADVESVAILDNSGRVVGHTDKQMYGKMLTDDFSVEAATQTAPVFRIDEIDSKKVMTVAMPIDTSLEGLPGIRWGTIIASLSLARAEREMRNALWHSLKIMAVFALLTGLLLFFMAERSFLRPLAILTEAAEALRGGDFGARAGLRGGGELSLLSRTFDGMAEELQKYTTRLQKLVYERTEKLNKTNQELVSTMQKLKEANESLEELARTDALTGLYNHRHMKEVLAFHFALAKRGSRALSFAMMDVDHFKNYNDAHGHPAGDIVLKSLASIIRDRIRQTDIPCRYGGEEFVVMFLDTTPEQALNVMEYLRAQIEAYDFPSENTQPGGQVTVSIGIASLVDGMEEPMELLERADEALYRAKERGRNRVVMAEPT